MLTRALVNRLLEDDGLPDEDLKARILKQCARIDAEVHTDDFSASAKFNAIPWFEVASDRQILDLAKIEWRGDYAADCIAEYCAGHDKGVNDVFNDVFKYKRRYNQRAIQDGTMGFEVSVD